jgi:hypothetical protein
MGLFKKDEEAVANLKEAADARRSEAVRKKHDKARLALEKRGVDLDGVIIFDDSFDDGAYEYLLVFPDRVEYINMGKIGTFTKKGRGTEVIPISRISSVQTRKKVIFEIVEIKTSGATIEFKSTPMVAPLLKSTILDLMNGSQESSSSPPNDADQLVRLAELHRDGILTEEEFISKKAEILGRM